MYRPPGVLALTGFSLVEMLVVLALVSLLSFLILPRFHLGESGGSPDENAAAVSAFIHQSQALAMGSGRALEISVAADGKGLFRDFLPRPAAGKSAATVVGIHLPAQIQLAFLPPDGEKNEDANGTRLVINADGASLPFSVRIRDQQGNERLLSFSPFLAVTETTHAKLP